MAVTIAAATGTKQYTVLRPIFVGGARVEVGESVELNIAQAAALVSAGKIGPFVEKAKTKSKPAESKTADVPAA